MDHNSGAIWLDRHLFTAMAYPADYGFIPHTLAEDGDPLDILLLLDEPTFPGCHVRARPIGVFRMRDDKGIDAKILCVPADDPRWSDIQDLRRPTAPPQRDPPLLRGVQGARAGEVLPGRGLGGLHRGLDHDRGRPRSPSRLLTPTPRGTTRVRKRRARRTAARG